MWILSLGGKCEGTEVRLGYMPEAENNDDITPASAGITEGLWT